MSLNNLCRWALRITHMPTGFSVQTDSTSHRTMRAAYEKLIRVVKASIYQKGKVPAVEHKKNYYYILPDTIQYPDDLEQFRAVKLGATEIIKKLEKQGESV